MKWQTAAFVLVLMLTGSAGTWAQIPPAVDTPAAAPVDDGGMPIPPALDGAVATDSKLMIASPEEANDKPADKDLMGWENDTSEKPETAPETVTESAPSPVAAPSAPSTNAVPAETPPAASEIPSPAASLSDNKTDVPAVNQQDSTVKSDETLTAVIARIEALEKSVADLQADRATKADLAMAIAAVKQSVASASADVSAPVKPAAVKKAPPRKKKSAKKTSAAVPTTRWVLKSAQAGRAWVSEPGSRDIKMVGVGDTLHGLGKITSINTEKNGRWVVLGTAGRINQ